MKPSNSFKITALIAATGLSMMAVTHAEPTQLTAGKVYGALQQQAPRILKLPANQSFKVAYINQLLDKLAEDDYHWSCKVLKQNPNVDPTTKNGVVWTQLQCQGEYPKDLRFLMGSTISPLTINIVDANLTQDKHITVTPALAQNGQGSWYYTQPVGPDPQQPQLISMAQQDPNRLAGINGGYFFENSDTKKDFSDTNCVWKGYPQKTPAGVGDGLLIINGQAYSTNCPLFAGWPIPPRATFVVDKQGQYGISNIAPSISPNNLSNALGAGPAMIDSNNENQQPTINMKWQYIPSTFEFSANTAVALGKDKKGNQHVVLFTVDGDDKNAGMFSFEMANFLHKMLPSITGTTVTSAMSMDQGGSTTMYVKGSGVVSKSDNSGKVRSVYDALFISLKPTNNA